MSIRCGDSVHHEPTGENWLVAYVDGDRIAWCGWPEGEAYLADCKLVRSCSDKEHVSLLRQIARGSGLDRRHRRAALDLAAFLAGKKVRFAHEPDGPDRDVSIAGNPTMLAVEGLSGEFAPHLFTIPEIEA